VSGSRALLLARAVRPRGHDLAFTHLHRCPRRPRPHLGVALALQLLVRHGPRVLFRQVEVVPVRNEVPRPPCILQRLEAFLRRPQLPRGPGAGRLARSRGRRGLGLLEGVLVGVLGHRVDDGRDVQLARPRARLGSPRDGTRRARLLAVERASD